MDTFFCHYLFWKPKYIRGRHSGTIYCQRRDKRLFIRGKAGKKKKKDLKSWRGGESQQPECLPEGSWVSRNISSHGAFRTAGSRRLQGPTTTQEELPQAISAHEPLHKPIQYYLKIHQASCPPCGEVASDGPVVKSHFSPKDTTSAK